MYVFYLIAKTKLIIRWTKVFFFFKILLNSFGDSAFLLILNWLNLNQSGKLYPNFQILIIFAVKSAK